MNKKHRRVSQTIMDAAIIWKNFSGSPDKFNPMGGKRKFTVLIKDEAVIEAMTRDGWNISELCNKDDPTDCAQRLEVAVRFDVVPPRVTYLKEDGTKLELDEKSIGMLDHRKFLYADITVTPYEWEFGGNSGVKAYLSEMYVQLEESPLDAKYQDWGKEPF